ncbi:hypothetical protein TRFO_12253 [Tritrichomonas foetus]|uniref:Coatomer subunit delta n=1 Tax=Tritrichomonas foetus TaxID=1144522 RepID=A0A1J4IZP2_9EUKA|nr:hypothetical protein TRFO_12253 [Tritrichomonas foetus]|eukprot:OHS92878.1 hypothetical protein TRFO_12253 [Tritrichomonas foetus]
MIYTVAIITHAGKLVLARQFTHENRNHIEGQLGAFQKLVQFSGHSYIDTEKVRFVFQEINELYIILVVSKDSNLVSDLEALSLLVDVTRNMAGDFSEEKIIKKSLDLIFAYDECIFDGFKQNFTAANIIHFLKMDSAEEAEANRIRAEKEALAAAYMKKKAMEFEENRIHQKSSLIPSFVQNSISNTMNNAFNNTPTTSIPQQGGYNSGTQVFNEEENYSRPRASKPARSGMSLTRSAGSKTRAQQVMAEEGLEAPPPKAESSNTNVVSSPVKSNDFVITIHEKFTATLSRLDAVREVGVEGRLMASYNRKLNAIIQIDSNALPANYRYKVMQQPRGKLWNDRKMLVYDNTGEKYGPGTDVTLLCWRMTSTNRDDLPINVSCWVQQSRNGSTFSCDVELVKDGFSTDTLEITIPVIDASLLRNINITQCSSGNVETHERELYLKWVLDPLDDSNSKAELEFSTQSCEDDAFYPVSIAFMAPTTICDVEVLSLEPGEDEDSPMPKIECHKVCATNRFEIE